MSENDNHSGEVLMTALIGSLVLGASAALLTSKSGKKITNDFCQRCSELKDDVKGFVSDLGGNEDQNGESIDWSGQAKKIMETVVDGVNLEAVLEHKELGFGLIAGGIVGGLIGSNLAKSMIKEELNQMDLIDKIAAKSPAIKIVIKDVLDVLNDGIKPAKPQRISTNDVLDLVVASLELWKKLKK